MLKFLYLNFKKGIEKVIVNPQLIYTVVVAVLIISSFVFMSERFINIANDAQERLINVRIGSLQDAFVSFAGDKIDDSEYLNKKIEEIVATNETIRDFKVIKKQNNIDVDTGKNSISYITIASSSSGETKEEDNKISFLYSLASSNPTHSVTIALEDQGERLFKTTRAILDKQGDTVGVVVTTQTLSMADVAIENSIKNSRITLLFILLLVIFVFLRHSRMIDYIDLYKKLKEVNQMKDNFISMASHELRTPLSVIRGYAEFASEAPELSKETKEFISKIDISTKELDFLVADILDVSRIEQGRMSFEMEKINPNVLIQEVVSSFVLPVKEKGLSINFDKTKTTQEQYINIDKNRLKQVLVNLVGNSVKYTVKGDIIVSQYTENGRLYIRVSDTGLGMSEEEKSKLFEKFYRIRNKDTENIRGTGLGLWITAQIIKQMNGKISVESIKGVGSHFIVSFPLV